MDSGNAQESMGELGRLISAESVKLDDTLDTNNAQNYISFVMTAAGQRPRG